MSYNNVSLPILEAMQRYGNTGKTYGILDFVQNVSDANPITIDASPVPGKKRTTRLAYSPMICDIEGDCNDSVCDGSDLTPEPTTIDFTVNKCFATKRLSFNGDNARSVDPSEWDFEGIANEIMMHKMPALRKGLAQRWISDIYALRGVHSDGNTTRQLRLKTTDNNTPNPSGLDPLTLEYMDSGFSGEVFTLGGQNLWSYKRLLQGAGLNDSGVNIGNSPTANMYYDDGILNTVVGASGQPMLSISSESIKYVQFINNAGKFRTGMDSFSDINLQYKNSTDHFIKGIISDPVTNIIWDLYMYFDPCNDGGTWTYQLKHEYDFFVMPDVSCDQAEGMNGILLWLDCAPVIAECPAGDTASPAVTPTAFNYTFGGGYPYTVLNATLGGQVKNFAENPQTVANVTELVALFNTEFPNTQFSVNGAAVKYTGYTALTGNFNSGDETITFA